jgi:hypothetical protein
MMITFAHPRQARIDRLDILATGLRLVGWTRILPAPPFKVVNIRESSALLQFKVDIGAMFSALFGLNTPGP